MADYDELHMHVSKTDLVPTNNNTKQKLFPLKSIANRKTGTKRMNKNKNGKKGTKPKNFQHANFASQFHFTNFFFCLVWYLAYVYRTMTMPNKSA